MNQTRRKTGMEWNQYSMISIIAFGILGNILVVISIARQKRLLRRNHYFLVLQLAICDLSWLFFNLVGFFQEISLIQPSMISCILISISDAFQISGLAMMMIISVLRYRAVEHPLKPAISQRRLKLVCGSFYIIGFIIGYGPMIPFCFPKVKIAYFKFHAAYLVSVYYFFPSVFMGVVYFKIDQSLSKQKKTMKIICPNTVRQKTPNSSFITFVRNRRAFLVCLSTTSCYGVGNIPVTIWLLFYLLHPNLHQQLASTWFPKFALVLRVAGSSSINPLIYGFLDKTMFAFLGVRFQKRPRLRVRQPRPV